MRRISRYINRFDYAKTGIPQQFFETIGTVKLSPGEQIPDLVPLKSWIFVEDGFLLLKERAHNRWACRNIYYEGTSTVFYNKGAAQLENGSMQVEAVEPSTVYYLSPSDETNVDSFFPNFSFARMVFNSRSFRQHQRRTIIFEVNVKQRVQFVERHFPVMFRVPFDDLAEFLGIRDKPLQMALKAAQRRYLSRNVH